jgi:hypothetical protein
MKRRGGGENLLMATFSEFVTIILPCTMQDVTYSVLG